LDCNRSHLRCELHHRRHGAKEEEQQRSDNEQRCQHKRAPLTARKKKRCDLARRWRSSEDAHELKLDQVCVRSACAGAGEKVQQRAQTILGRQACVDHHRGFSSRNRERLYLPADD
jgi:hypothetical protein